MVLEEKYLLVKHANYTPEYVDNAPVYERRFLLNLLRTELEEMKEAQEKASRKNNQTVSRSRSRR